MAEPIYGRKLRIPRGVGLVDMSGLVHLIWPIIQAWSYSQEPNDTVGRFTGMYATCAGLLDDSRIVAPPNVKLSWLDWVVPSDTPLTCFECLQREEAEHARRRA